NFDVLPLYIVLMLVFPIVLWCMLRQPDIVMLCSVLLYFSARHFAWNLPSYPSGHWYFNPFCWQILFMFGAWFALGGVLSTQPIIRSRTFIILGSAYLLFALVMTMAGRFPDIGRELFPDWLFNAFNPNDKTNMAPYRVIHFLVVAFMITRFLPRHRPDLAGVRARDHLWPALARGVLRRRVPGVRGAFHTVAASRPSHADRRQRRRHPAALRDRLLQALVRST